MGQWNGKPIPVGWFSKERVAAHEAGHALVAYHLGLVIEGISINVESAEEVPADYPSGVYWQGRVEVTPGADTFQRCAFALGGCLAEVAMGFFPMPAEHDAQMLGAASHATIAVASMAVQKLLKDNVVALKVLASLIASKERVTLADVQETCGPRLLGDSRGIAC